MPNEMTPAIKTYEALIKKLKGRDALIAKVIKNAHGYRFQDGVLYLRYPGYLANVSARILIDSEHKPILDKAATEMSIQVMLE
jgi:hypothetical protein